MTKKYDLSDEYYVRSFPALRLIGVRREIMTIEGLIEKEDMDTIQREAAVEEIEMRKEFLEELETSLNALYDLDRDRENDPNLKDVTLSNYMTLLHSESDGAIG